MNQPLTVEANFTATVYSVEPAGDNSTDIVITVATNSSESPATLTDQLALPLEQILEEVTEINEEISFAIEDIDRHGKYFPARTCGWLCMVNVSIMNFELVVVRMVCVCLDVMPQLHTDGFNDTVEAHSCVDNSKIH